jgi:hypothetical protein
VTFHDADDISLPTRVERQLGALGSTGAAVCTTNIVRMSPAGRVVFFRDHVATRLGMVSLMLTRDLLRAQGPFRAARFGADHEYHEDLIATLPPARIVRLREPLLLGLWSTSSLTRASGAESLETGYRSPARCHGALRASEEEIAAKLADAGNMAEPRGIDEL